MKNAWTDEIDRLNTELTKHTKIDNTELKKYIVTEIEKLNNKINAFEHSAALDRTKYWCWSAQEQAYRDVLNKIVTQDPEFAIDAAEYQVGRRGE
jgi:hypothetical protein